MSLAKSSLCDHESMWVAHVGLKEKKLKLYYCIDCVDLLMGLYCHTETDTVVLSVSFSKRPLEAHFGIVLEMTIITGAMVTEIL